MMTVQSRQTKVLVALLASIVLCTIILNVLGHNPPSAGAFCLSQYYSLVPVEKLVRSREVQRPRYFKWIEIYDSEDGSDQEDIDCHFIIYNGLTGHDGQIKPTEKWKRQLPANLRPDDNTRCARQYEQTIYICVVMDGQSTQPTNFQIKRVQVLIEELCREFNIKSESVLYPNNWQY